MGWDGMMEDDEGRELVAGQPVYTSGCIIESICLEWFVNISWSNSYLLGNGLDEVYSRA